MSQDDIEMVRRPHLHVEDDCWFCCAACEDCCCDDNRRGLCDCGADIANAALDRLEARLHAAEELAARLDTNLDFGKLYAESEAKLHAAEEQATALFKFNDELRAERDRLREALGRVIYRTDPDWTELAALSSTQEDFDKEYREVEGDAPEWNG